MSDAETLVPVTVPGRDIPPPTTISDAARRALSDSAALPNLPRHDPADLPAWREAIAESDATWGVLAQGMLATCTASIETRAIAGVPCYVSTPPDAVDAPVYLYIHGGAFVFGGGAFARAQGALAAEKLGVVTVSVDYRMPPDHPFPAAPEDCLAVYRALIAEHDPARIVIGGSSAGGNLAAATTLMIRDQGLPQPAAVILLTPEIDLTEAGDTFQTNIALDVILKKGLPECNALYAAGHDLTDPYLSPLFADFTAGYPPTMIQSGTRDLFLSNSVLIHRKLREAGIEAELHVWEAMPHGGFGFGPSPENAAVDREVARFIRKHCP
ncbi:alpha/beta hydrolase [Sphingomonas sp. MMS24-J13]|uniref:alpha/beta hydrolase n=1 Tax=Sphingomonas sp. MMS24-J13 TaxID=3238686 RepID=UPI00384BC3AE